MNTLIAKKVGMTQIFDENSNSLGVTVLDVSDCRVVQVKNSQKDGYKAVQLTIGSKKKLSKPLESHYKKYKVDPGEILYEVRINEDTDLNPGQKISVKDIFEVGQKVDITGISKGKGFAGVMKRHNFSGLRASHGVSISHRSHGSTGQRQDPGKVFKNKKMAGHMGDKLRSIQNIEIIKSDIENNLLYLKGSIPGSKNTEVLVKKSVKNIKKLTIKEKIEAFEKSKKTPDKKKKKWR